MNHNQLVVLARVTLQGELPWVVAGAASDEQPPPINHNQPVPTYSSMRHSCCRYNHGYNKLI